MYCFIPDGRGHWNFLKFELFYGTYWTPKLNWLELKADVDDGRTETK